ncbi:DNA adenine methylase [Virgibacillus halodenitrificans]|uniref:DNA adenine methylase n=1 Tax=Virgibacillus halodenitrificans TaxID=1482 RepID=UPI000EF4BFDC|nr:DNA adenine methylase [Virgibacillus halodenitrificans]
MDNYINCQSPIRYFGGKSFLAPSIISLLPEHTRYVELFGGGGHVLSQKKPSAEEVYNDIDADLINFFDQAKNNGFCLTKELLSLPTSRFLFEKWKNEPFPEDALEWACRWFYLIRQRIHPSNATLKSGWRAGKVKNLALDYQNAVKKIPSFSKRLKDVTLTNQDFRKVIATYDSEDTVWFIDPPYVEREQYYKGGFTIDDHIELAQMLYFIQGKAIVTYYDHPLINELYAHWKRIEIDTYVGSGVVKIGEKRKKEKEIILMNYEPNKNFKQQSLFS